MSAPTKSGASDKAEDPSVKELTALLGATGIGAPAGDAKAGDAKAGDAKAGPVGALPDAQHQGAAAQPGAAPINGAAAAPAVGAAVPAPAPAPAAAPNGMHLHRHVQNKCYRCCAAVDHFRVRFTGDQSWEFEYLAAKPGATFLLIDKEAGTKHVMAVGDQHAFVNQGDFKHGVAIDGGSANTSFYNVGPTFKLFFAWRYFGLTQDNLPIQRVVGSIEPGRLAHPDFCHWQRLAAV